MLVSTDGQVGQVDTAGGVCEQANDDCKDNGIISNKVV